MGPHFQVAWGTLGAKCVFNESERIASFAKRHLAFIAML